MLSVFANYDKSTEFHEITELNGLNAACNGENVWKTKNACC